MAKVITLHGIRGIDASKVPTIPSWARWVGGYIGGPTPHVWTKADWDSVSGRKKLPIQTASIAGGQPAEPVKEAFAALESLYSLKVPKGVLIAWDMETMVDRPYVNTVYDIIKWGGYHMVTYGSASTVFGNPECDGYYVAKWNGVPDLSGQATRIVQYMNGSSYDYDEMRDWQYHHHMWN